MIRDARQHVFRVHLVDPDFDEPRECEAWARDQIRRCGTLAGWQYGETADICAHDVDDLGRWLAANCRRRDPEEHKRLEALEAVERYEDARRQKEMARRRAVKEKEEREAAEERRQEELAWAKGDAVCGRTISSLNEEELPVHAAVAGYRVRRGDFFWMPEKQDFFVCGGWVCTAFARDGWPRWYALARIDGEVHFVEPWEMVRV